MRMGTHPKSHTFFAIVNLLLEYADLRQKFSLPLPAHFAFFLEKRIAPLSPSFRLVFFRALSPPLLLSLSLDLALSLLPPHRCQLSLSLQVTSLADSVKCS